MRQPGKTPRDQSEPVGASPIVKKHTSLARSAAALNQAEPSAYLGKAVRLQGLMVFTGAVRIDGRVEGEIRSDGVVVIGEEATVHAKVYARTVLCQGRVTGDLVAREALLLLNPARLEGSIRAPTVVMEEGVSFNGTSLIGPVTEESGQPQPPHPAPHAASL